MASSSKDLFHLDPPEAFTYRDFVITAPYPRVPKGLTEDVAKTKYPRTRMKRLVERVEARLGKGRCFFSEFQPKDKKKASQFEIAKLFALYEVEHWPGAVAQYEWTQFVFANIERDALTLQGQKYAKLARKFSLFSLVLVLSNLVLTCCRSATSSPFRPTCVSSDDQKRGL